MCLAGFLLASAPQLIPTALEHGNPFWNRQDANVYFGMFGGMNWARGWPEAMKHEGGVVGLVREHPRAFVDNVIWNAVEVARQFVFLPAVLVVPGTLLALRSRRARSTAGLVVGAAVVYGVALCLTFVTRRLMLPLWPASMVLAAYAVMEVRPRHVRVGPAQLSAPLAALAILLCSAGLRDAVRLHDWLAPTDSTRVSDALRRHGMTRGDEVLSFDFPYYHVGSKLAESFAMPWYFPEQETQLHTVDDVVGAMQRKGMRFLVFNDNLRRWKSPARRGGPTPCRRPSSPGVYTDPGCPARRGSGAPDSRPALNAAPGICAQWGTERERPATRHRPLTAGC